VASVKKRSMKKPLAHSLLCVMLLSDTKIIMIAISTEKVPHWFFKSNHPLHGRILREAD